jgi:glutamyl-tRNA synthetase
MGYLPAALRNYLVRLGWSHGDDEIFTTEQAAAWFDIDDVNKAAARFDFKKLADLNGHYIRAAPNDEALQRLRELLPHLEGGARLEECFATVGWDKLAAALPGLKDRAKTLVELVQGADWLIAERPLKPADDKTAKLIAGDGKAVLAALLPRLQAVAEWTAPALEAAVRAHVEATGLKLGAVAQPLRAALTGKSVSPPVFDVMAVLGREEALGRIGDVAA